MYSLGLTSSLGNRPPLLVLIILGKDVATAGAALGALTMACRPDGPGLSVTDSIGISSRKMIKRAIRTHVHPMLPCELRLSVEPNLICSGIAAYRQNIWSRCVRLSCSAS